MLCEGMEVIANSLQDFGSWGRRVRSDYPQAPLQVLIIRIQLVTIKKTTSKQFPPPTFEPIQPSPDESAHVPAHRDFREKYFQGFKPKSNETSVAEEATTS